MTLLFMLRRVRNNCRRYYYYLLLTPARQAGTRRNYPGGMKGWVDLDGNVGRYVIVVFLYITTTLPFHGE